MSEIQERQNQRIIDYAEANFSKTTHEYGRQDMARRSANKSGEKIDPSRLNEDKIMMEEKVLIVLLLFIFH